MTRRTRGAESTEKTVTDKITEFSLDKDRIATSLAAAQMAREVTEHLGHQVLESLREFRDGRITISCDQNRRAVSVSIYLQGTATRVLYTREGEDHPRAFRPGRWLDHLYAVTEKATAARKETEQKRARERAENHAELFSPIDDAELFADVERTSLSEERS